MRTLSLALLYFLTFLVAAFAVFAYGFLPLGSLVHPEMKVSFLSHPSAIYTHIFASTIALVLGPFQFSTRLRQKYKNLHRWLGRIYLAVGVFIGGLAGLYISQFAYGGLISKLGFAALAVLWLYTGSHAYLAIRAGAIVEHRKWMIRNFALTFAAVTLRLYLPASMVAGIDFSLAYPIIAWLCWVPNIVFAEWRYITPLAQSISQNHSRVDRPIN
jgi:uncharacterized membrane protein